LLGASRPPRNWRRRDGEYGELRCEKPIIDYFRSDRFFVGCEGNESALSYVIDRIGPKAACLRRTFRTKSRWKTHCTRSMKFSNGKDINDKHKAIILGENAKRFYNL
jgi:hypothetical protein